MRWGSINVNKFKKRKDPLAGYQPEKWPAPNYRYNFQKSKKSSPKTFYRVVVAFAILAVFLVAKESGGPVSQQVRGGLRYMLSTEWNLQPTLDKAVQIGLQTVNMDFPIFKDLGGQTLPAMSNQPKADNWPLPVSGKLVTSYGMVKEPGDSIETFHPGIDIGAAMGTPVKVVKDGQVAQVGQDKNYGRFVLVDHGQGSFTLYAGLEDITVKEKQQVRVEDVIGKIGPAKEGQNPALHFEVRENNQLVNPLSKMHLASDTRGEQQ